MASTDLSVEGSESRRHSERVELKVEIGRKARNDSNFAPKTSFAIDKALGSILQGLFNPSIFCDSSILKFRSKSFSVKPIYFNPSSYTIS